MQIKTLTCFAIIYFYFFQSNLVTGQNYQWGYSTGALQQTDWGRSLAVDDNGNVYTASQFNHDMAVFKNDAMGNLVWSDLFSGSIDSITNHSPAMTIDNNGNLYLTGTFINTLDFDPGASVFNMTATGGGAAYILKLDSAGNFIWAKMIDAYNDLSKGTDIQFSANGFIVISGIYRGQIDFDPGIGVSNSNFSGSNDNAFVIRLDTAGNFAWGADLGGTCYSYCYDLSIDVSDNIILSGHFNDTVDFDPGPSVYSMTSLGYTTYILKLDDAGNFVWVRPIGGINLTNALSFGVDTDPSGNVYASGIFHDTIDFDPGPGVFLVTSNGIHDGFIVKLDANGNFVWVYTFGGPSFDYAEALTYSNQGAIIVTGGIRDSADFDPGPGILTITSNGDQDIILLALDVNGSLNSVKSFGSYYTDYGSAVTTDNINNIYITGIFKGTVDFNPPFQSNLISSVSYDIFTVKFDALSLGVPELKENDVFDVYPNPGNGNFTLEFDDFYSGEYVISNLLGEQIKTASFENSKTLECEIDGAAGIYFVRLKTRNNIFNAKLIKN